MPRLNVIILDQTRDDPSTYSIVLWADVPSARQLHYAQASTFISAWPGATTQDNANLVSGAVVEKVVTQRIPVGTGLAQIEAFLQSQWNSYQNFVTAYNPWQRFGSTWDGTTWIVTNNG